MTARPVLYVAGGYASGFVAHAIKSHADSIGARIVGKLDLNSSPTHRAAPGRSAATHTIQPDLFTTQGTDHV